MRMPSQLQDMAVFNGAESYAGLCLTFTRPKLSMKMEDYRGGGMPGPVDMQMGLEKLEVTHKYGGDVPSLLRDLGAPRADDSQLRFAGAYRNDSTGTWDDVQIVIRGRHVEADSGDDEVGSKSGSTFKTSCTYYKQTRNGAVEIEIDLLGGIFTVFGVDRLAESRRITG